MNKKYKIFVSGMAYDSGKSGISFYIRKVVKYLAKNNEVDLLMLKSDVEKFPIKSTNLKIIKISDLLANPVLNMLWHLFILPFTQKYKKYDFIPELVKQYSIELKSVNNSINKYLN